MTSRLSFLSILMFVCIINCTHAQSSSLQILSKDDFTFEEIFSLPKALKESSGLEITSGNRFWSHNDDGIPVLFCMDSTGNVIRTIHLNHPNEGWEDMAQDELGNLYIGAFGNNKNDKQDLKIYKITQPDSITDKVYTASIIRYKYQDQKAFPPAEASKNFDMDAFTIFNDSLFLFTKNRTQPFTGYTKVYRAPVTPGHYDLAPVDSIFLGNDGAMLNYWVTSADVSPDKKTLALLSHDRLWLITNFRGSKFSSGEITEVKLNHFTHKAGICFASNKIIFITDELELGMIGGKMYKLKLKNQSE